MVLVPQARCVRTQPRVLILGNNVMIIALKGLQGASRERNNSFFEGRDRVRICLLRDVHNLSSLQDGSRRGGFPRINPWAESSRPAPAGLKPSQKILQGLFPPSSNNRKLSEDEMVV
jgi:hypothetical protein